MLFKVQDMENSDRDDSKGISVDGHCGNDVVCGVSQQCHAEDTTEDNLCASRESVNTATTEDNSQSASNLPECEGLSVSKDIQLETEDNCFLNSHKQTSLYLQSESPDSSLTDSASEAPPVGDNSNALVEVVEETVPGSSLSEVLLNDDISWNNDVQGKVDIEALDHYVPPAQTIKTKLVVGKSAERSDTLNEERAESVLLAPEPCPENDRSVILEACDKQLMKQFGTKENDESCNRELVVSCTGNLQCESPECLDKENVINNTKAYNVDDNEGPAANNQHKESCSNEQFEQLSCADNHLCLGDEFLHCQNCGYCKDLIVRNSAASVVDEILRLATKHVVKVKFKNRIVNEETENVNYEDNEEGTSVKNEDSIKAVRKKSKLETAVVQYVKPFDIGNSLLRQSSKMNYSLSKSVPDLSLCKELIVQTDDQEFQTYIQAISGCYIAPLQNGSIVLSTQRNHLDSDNIPKTDSSVLTLMEWNEQNHSLNSAEEEKSVLVSKVERSKSGVEEMTNEKEECSILNKHSNINKFDESRQERISDEGNAVNSLTFDSVNQNPNLSRHVEQLHCLNSDADRGSVIPHKDFTVTACCAPASANSNQKCKLCRSNVTTSLDGNAELIIPQFGAKAKDLKDCLVNGEGKSTALIETKAQCGLGDLGASAENLNNEDSKTCEDSITICSLEDVDAGLRKDVVELNEEETNVHSGATCPELCNDSVSDKSEPLENVMVENLGNCSLNSEPGCPTSQALAEASSASEEMSRNSNTAAAINITLSPSCAAGDHPELSMDKKEQVLGKVGALGDVPAPISYSEKKEDDANLRSFLQGLPPGTQVESLNCLVANKSRHPILSNDVLHPLEGYATILEEDCEGASTEESELSHTTSDSENDLNLKISKSSHDGTNSISYLPLLEEDINSRSTLSLISELDETCKDTNLLDDQVEDDSSALLKTEDEVERVDEIDLVSQSFTSELTQRVNGQRIKHGDKEVHDEEMGKDTPLTEYTEKIKEIKNVLESSRSVERLRQLARSRGGLVTDGIRREAWPLLLGIDSASAKSCLPHMDASELRSHPEYNQVVLDVNRSLRRFPSKISPEERLKLQEQLTEIILRVLIKRRNLCYYQGYHDVAVTTLLVAGKDAAFHILEQISTAHLADCMLPTMDRTMYLLNYIYPLLQRINPHLAERLDRLEVGTIFCLPWFLTWYGYSLNRYEDVVRCFDYFVASPPLAPLYLAAVVVGHRSSDVLTADCDQATVHALLSRIPNTLNLEQLLAEATDLYQNFPPSLIESEVGERTERLRRIQEEEEERRRRIRQGRLVRRHSMPAMAQRQMPGWYFFEHFLRYAPKGRFARLSATIMFGVIAWNWRNEMMRYF